MNRLKLALASLAVGISLAAAPTVASAGAWPADAVTLRLAEMSKLGDLTPFKSIVKDTLAIVDKGDITAARTRIKDLEVGWDKSEATLKPKDVATWTKLDDAIDEALTALRTPNPAKAECAAALKALMARMDAVSQA